MAYQQLNQQSISTYANLQVLALETDLFANGTVVAVDSPPCLLTATQTSPASTGLLSYATSTSASGVVTYWTQGASIQRFGATFTLAQLQAIISNTPFVVGPVLPANAKLIGAEVVVNQALAGNTSDLITVQGGTDAAGTIIASTSIFTGGSPVVATTGSNPYRSRGGQQIYATILGGAALTGLTAGNITINLYVAVGL